MKRISTSLFVLRLNNKDCRIRLRDLPSDGFTSSLIEQSRLTFHVMKISVKGRSFIMKSLI